MTEEHEVITYEELEAFDHISVELVPEKKGIILKHCEYSVSSRRHGTTVSRRYSEFAELHDVLLAKYPYRAVCRLPPKRLTVGGGGASFLERRRAALQRWLALTAAHPVLAHDADTRAFLCEPAPRLQRPQRDEFTLAGAELTEAECVTEEMTSWFSSEQEQLGLVTLGLARLAQIFQRAEERCERERGDGQEAGAALAALGVPGARDPLAWAPVRGALRRAATAAARREEGGGAESEARARLRLALDAGGAHRDLCARLTRGLHAERAQAAARATSLPQAGAAAVLRARHCYALRCARGEAGVARAYLLAALRALPDLAGALALEHARAAAAWAELSKTLQARA